MGGVATRMARGEVGELCWANVVNGLENRRAEGKERPALVIDGSVGHLVVAGFTSRAVARCGWRRPEVPSLRPLGLARTGYLWSNRTAIVSRIDLGEHIGWADSALIELVLTHVTMPTPLRIGLRSFQAGPRCTGEVRRAAEEGRRGRVTARHEPESGLGSAGGLAQWGSSQVVAGHGGLRSEPWGVGPT